MAAWDDIEFVVFDLETTGLDAHLGEEIIEIGAVKFKGLNLEPMEEYSTFIKPSKLIPEESTKINGISNDMVSLAPPIHEVFDPFMKFMKGAVPIAQNAKFDVSFLQPHIEKNQYLGFHDFCIDTKLLAKKIWFYERGHNLDTILARLGIKYDSKTRHRSVADCKLTARCFTMMVKKLNLEGILDLKKYSIAVEKPKINDQATLPLFNF